MADNIAIKVTLENRTDAVWLSLEPTQASACNFVIVLHKTGTPPEALLDFTTGLDTNVPVKIPVTGPDPLPTGIIVHSQGRRPSIDELCGSKLGIQPMAIRPHPVAAGATYSIKAELHQDSSSLGHDKRQGQHKVPHQIVEPIIVFAISCP